MRKFIRVGNRVINPDVIATVNLSQESVTIVLITPNDEQLTFSGDEAKVLQDYFSNPSHVEMLQPQRPRLNTE